MSGDILDQLPRKGETWKHTKTGGLYTILGASFNTITDTVDVVYVPVEPNPDYERFNRQMLGHPKAFLSKNEDGSPRFSRVRGAA